jgi:hypothetical protein
MANAGVGALSRQNLDASALTAYVIGEVLLGVITTTLGAATGSAAARAGSLAGQSATINHAAEEGMSLARSLAKAIWVAIPLFLFAKWCGAPFGFGGNWGRHLVDYAPYLVVVAGLEALKITSNTTLFMVGRPAPAAVSAVVSLPAAFLALRWTPTEWGIGATGFSRVAAALTATVVSLLFFRHARAEGDLARRLDEVGPESRTRDWSVVAQGLFGLAGACIPLGLQGAAGRLGEATAYAAAWSAYSLLLPGWAFSAATQSAFGRTWKRDRCHAWRWFFLGLGLTYLASSVLLVLGLLEPTSLIRWQAPNLDRVTADRAATLLRWLVTAYLIPDIATNLLPSPGLARGDVSFLAAARLAMLIGIGVAGSTVASVEYLLVSLGTITAAYNCALAARLRWSKTWHARWDTIPQAR